MIDLRPDDTRVVLFHAPNAAANPGAATDGVNAWLSKDRSTSTYPNLRVREITVTPDGRGGLYVTVVCSLGEAASAPSESAPARSSRSAKKTAKAAD